MNTYEVQDNLTGRKVKFDWRMPNPPTDADIDEIFVSAGIKQPAKPAITSLGMTPGAYYKQPGGIELFQAEPKIIPRPAIQPPIPQLPETPEFRPAKELTPFEKLGRIISKPFIKTPEEQNARAQAVYSIQKQVFPYASFMEIDENLDQITKQLGIRTTPTTQELIGEMFKYPIASAFMSNPVSAGLGLAAFMGLSEVENFVISKVQGEPYRALAGKGISELLPQETNQLTKDIVDIADFMAKGAVLRVIYKKSPAIIEKFTKDIITKYNMPRKVYIEGQKVADVMGMVFREARKKPITPEEEGLIIDLGLTGKQLREAWKKGVTVEVPIEKVVTMADKPYWAKLKGLFNIKPSVPEVKIIRPGVPTVGPRAELPAPIIPQAPPIVPAVAPPTPAVAPPPEAPIPALTTPVAPGAPIVVKPQVVPTPPITKPAVPAGITGGIKPTPELPPREPPLIYEVKRNYSTPKTINTDIFRGGTWYASQESSIYDFAKEKGVGGRNILNTTIKLKNPLVIKNATFEDGSFAVINEGYENYLPPLQRKLGNEIWERIRGAEKIPTDKQYNNIIKDILVRNGNTPERINKVLVSKNISDAAYDLVISKGLKAKGYDALILKQEQDTHILKFGETKLPPEMRGEYVDEVIVKPSGIKPTPETAFLEAQELRGKREIPAEIQRARAEAEAAHSYLYELESARKHPAVATGWGLFIFPKELMNKRYDLPGYKELTPADKVDYVKQHEYAHQALNKLEMIELGERGEKGMSEWYSYLMQMMSRHRQMKSHMPTEAIANAYALWQVNPKYLKTNYPEISNWFQEHGAQFGPLARKYEMERKAPIQHWEKVIKETGGYFIPHKDFAVEGVQGNKVILKATDSYRVLRLVSGNIRLTDGNQVTIDTKEFNRDILPKGRYQGGRPRMQLWRTPEPAKKVQYLEEGLPEEPTQEEIRAAEEEALKEIAKETKGVPGQDLFAAITKLGKIGGEAGEGVPIFLTDKKSGNRMDTIISELASVYGFHFEDAESLRNAIKEEARRRGITITTTGVEPEKWTPPSEHRNVDVVKKMFRERKRQRVEKERMVESLAKEFERKSSLPQSQVKHFIREVTGQVKIGEVIREDEALERMLQQEANAARKAHAMGKRAGVEYHRAAVEAMNERKEHRQELRKQINKLIEDIKEVGKDLPRMSPAEAGPIKGILENVDLVKRKQSTILRLEKIRNFMETNTEAEMPDYVMEKLKILDRKNMNEITIDDLQAIHDSVLHYAHLNDVKNEIIVARKKRQAQAVLYDSIKEMKPAKEVDLQVAESIPNKKLKITRLVDKIKNSLGIWQEHYNLVVESLAGENSTMDHVLNKALDEGKVKELKYTQDAFKQFQEDLNLKDWMKKHGIKDLYEWGEEKVPSGFTILHGKKVPLSLSRGERMSLYRHSLNDDNWQAIIDGGFGLDNSPEKYAIYKIGPETMDYIIKNLSPAEKEFAGKPTDNLFENQYNELNKVFLEKNRYSLPKEEPYYPKDVMTTTLEPEKEALNTLEEMRRRWVRAEVRKGFLIGRKDSKKPIWLHNIFYDINRSVAGSAAYIGLEIPLYNASKLLYDPAFKTEMTHRYGEETWSVIEKGMRDIAGQFQGYDSMTKMILRIKNNISSATLGGSPFVWLKQPLSWILYEAYIKPQYLAEGFVANIVHPKETGERHRAYSPKYVERAGKGAWPEINDVFMMGGRGGWAPGVKPGIKERAMGIMELFDLGAVNPGMESAVRQVLAEFKEGHLSYYPKQALEIEDSEIAGLNPDEKMNLAYKFADWVTERTQPMSLPQYRSAISRNPTSNTLLGQYTASLNVFQNLLKRLYRDAQREKDPTKKRDKYLKFTEVVILIVLSQIAEFEVDELRRKALGQKPKKTWFTRLLLNEVATFTGMFYGLREVGNLVTQRLQGGMPGQDISIPIFSAANSAADLVTNVIKAGEATAEKDAGKQKKYILKALDSTADVASLVTGIPYHMPSRLIGAGIKKIVPETEKPYPQPFRYQKQGLYRPGVYRIKR